MGATIPASAADVPGPRLKLIFTGFIAFLAAAAVYSSVLIAQRQAVQDLEARYNITWLTSQAGLELARLEAMIGAARIPGTAISQQDIRTSFDTFEHRLQVVTNGEVGAFIAHRPELRGLATELPAKMAEVRSLPGGFDRPEAAGRVLALLTPLNTKLARLSSVAYTRSSDIATRDLNDLLHLQWIFSSLLGGLILGGFGLIASLSRHNLLLKRTHVDLQRTGEDLRARDIELGTQNARFDAALNNMSQALWMVDASRQTIVCNVRFLELFGLSSDTVRPGVAIADVFRDISAGGRYDRRIIETIEIEQLSLAATGRAWRFIQEDSRGRALSVSHQPMAAGGWVATYEDISDRRQAEARIRFMAHHDALTGLPNRLLLHERMKAMLERIRRPNDALAILWLDLDHFKDINDTLGHPAGDTLLETVARRLRGCVRTGDFVARLGGDEFAILQFSEEQPADAELLVKSIIETLREPYHIEGQPAIVSVSIGIAIARETGVNANILLKRADLALYRAKADGGSTYRFFEARMDAEIQARRAIELDLREALARAELELFYQPLFDLRRSEVSGFEALLRWRHPERGMVLPEQFIRIAEDLRLISAIGDWVLAQACGDAAARWPGHVKIAVNLSPMQFRRDDLVVSVEQAVSRSGLPAHRLEVEITESALLQHNDTVLSTLHRLRALGVRIALDDFGTGYSSLSYLRSFPFDRIKIDQSFVREIGRPDCFAIVTSIASLARQLGMSTTAEGVENAEQFSLLQAAGCDEVQGFYFDRPKPLAETFGWFGSGAARMGRAAA